MIHPVLGTPLPAPTVQVPRDQRDWDWHHFESKRTPLLRLVLTVKGRTCHLCGQEGATTADHVVPWSHGGPNTLENMEPAHRSCNSSRRDRTLLEWFGVRRVIRRLEPSREWV